MDRRKIDVAFSSLLIVISLIILTADNLVEGGMETELGSMFVPRVIAVFIILFAGTIGVESLLKLKRQEKKTSSEHIELTGFLGVVIYFAIFLFYWFIVPYVGFMAATPFVIFFIAYLLGGRNWIAIGAISITTPILIYYGCSQYLRIFLPTWSFS